MSTAYTSPGVLSLNLSTSTHNIGRKPELVLDRLSNIL